jgi:hypothetical protein
MDEIDFTLDGTRYRLTRDAVIKSMRKQIPGRIQTYVVDVEGIRFPVKQVLAQALQVPVTSFVSTRAQDLLGKLGFNVVNLEDAPEGEAVAGEPEATRELALQLAIQFHADRPTATAADVLEAATAFHTFLNKAANARA